MRRGRSVVTLLVVAATLVVIAVLFSVSRFSAMRNGNFSDATNQKLQNMLRSEDRSEQLEALLFMADWAPSDFVRSDVESLVGSEFGDIRLAAVRLIGRYGDKRAIRLLESCIGDPDEQVNEEIHRQMDDILTGKQD